MRHLVILLTLVLSSLSYASGPCEEHLGSFAQSLAAVMEQALQKGALTTSQFDDFLKAKKWVNPFLSSHEHLLRGKFRSGFQNIVDKMADADRELAWRSLGEVSDRLSGRKGISEQARRDTEFIFSIQQIRGFPGAHANGLQLWPGRLHDRPVFFGTNEPRASYYRSFLYDPHHPNDTKVLRYFEASKELETHLNGKPNYWCWDDPVFQNVHGRDSAVCEKQEVLYDLETAKQYPLPANLVIQQKLGHMRNLGNGVIGLYGKAGELLSKFHIPEKFHSPTNLDFPYFEHKGRTFAAITCAKSESKPEVFVVDVATGVAERSIAVEKGWHLKMVNKNGRPYAVGQSLIKHSNGSESADNKIRFYDLLDGTQSTITLDSDSYFGGVRAQFKFHGGDYIIWPEYDRFLILDVGSGAVTETKAPGLRYGDIMVYEYAGRHYALMGERFGFHFQLTAPPDLR